MATEIRVLEEGGSSMDLLRQEAQEGAPSWTAIRVNHMKQARGQHGRTWFTHPGGLHMSFLIREPKHPELLTLMVGQALADVLEMTGIDATTKWVNDVYIGDDKVAGILTEAQSSDHVEFAVIGIGLNLNGSPQAFPEELNATTVEAHIGVESCLDDTSQAILDAIRSRYDELEHDDPSRILEDARRRNYLLGKRVRVGEVEGNVDGLADDGALLVDGVPVRSGSVELLH